MLFTIIHFKILGQKLRFSVNLAWVKQCNIVKGDAQITLKLRVQEGEIQKERNQEIGEKIRKLSDRGAKVSGL